MDSITFVMELEQLKREVLSGLDNLQLVKAESGNKLEVSHLLRIALKNELEASELAAYWMSTTPEIDVKLGLARQSGDEAKHYRLIEKRLITMGVDLSSFNPLAGGYSKMFETLKAITDTVSRVAAGQFMREGIALKRNEQFIHFCESRGDEETARLYREIIQPDEEYHHQLGRALLEKYASDDAKQEAARKAALTTLQIAEELRGITEKKLKIAQIPGC